MNNTYDLNSAYQKAIELASSHYENFPVISLFLPKEKRKYVAAIYMFARTADDLADEGDDSYNIKLKKLDEYEQKFTDSLNGKYESELWLTVKDTIEVNKIDPQNLFNLLKAFKQDTWKNRYKSFDEVIEYCKNSADPVGRIILQLFGIYNEELNKLSDKICSALQLTNFWQDVAVDLMKDRIYLPQDDIEKFNLSFEMIINKQYSDNFKRLLQFEIQRTALMFDEGKELINHLPPFLKKQISFTVFGGETILKKIRRINYNVFSERPKIGKLEYILLFMKAMVK